MRHELIRVLGLDAAGLQALRRKIAYVVRDDVARVGADRSGQDVSAIGIG